MTLARWAAARTSEPSTNVRYSLLAGGGSATKISKGPSGGNGKTQAPNLQPPLPPPPPANPTKGSVGTPASSLGRSFLPRARLRPPTRPSAKRTPIRTMPIRGRCIIAWISRARRGLVRNLDVDAKPVGVYVQGWNGHDSVFLATEYRLDGQRGGQCALRRPIPSGRRPLTLRRF
jgi:hypothetical protein